MSNDTPSLGESEILARNEAFERWWDLISVPGDHGRVAAYSAFCSGYAAARDFYTRQSTGTTERLKSAEEIVHHVLVAPRYDGTVAQKKALEHHNKYPLEVKDEQ